MSTSYVHVDPFCQLCGSHAEIKRSNSLSMCDVCYINERMLRCLLYKGYYIVGSKGQLVGLHSGLPRGECYIIF